MPTYDYICQACEHEFEEFQSMSAKPLRKCPKCGKPKLKRLIGTGAGVIQEGCRSRQQGGFGVERNQERRQERVEVRGQKRQRREDRGEGE